MSEVEFPGLWGLRFSINRAAFKIPGTDIEIFWYGIIIAAAFLLSVLLAMRDSRKFGLEPDNIIDLVLFSAPVAFVFARIYYVIFSWKDYKDDILQIFNIRKGGLAIYGGIIGGLLVAYIFARKKKIGILKLFDFSVPYIVLGQGIGRWGNFINQEAFGTNTSLPWGMTSDTIKQYLSENMDTLRKLGMNIDPNLPVHPTFLYESIWDLAVFFFLIFYRKRKKLDGEVFFLYMILYGAGRFWIEGLRTDSLMLGSLRISRVLAAIFVVLLSIIFYLRRKRAAEACEDVQEESSSAYGEILKQLREEERISEEIKEQSDNVSDETSGDLETYCEDTGVIDETSDIDMDADEHEDEEDTKS